MRNYLNFEADIKKLENELDQLKDPFDNDGITEVNTDKITKIQKEIDHKLDTVIYLMILYPYLVTDRLQKINL